MDKIEGVTPQVEMDVGVIFAQYAILINRQMKLANGYTEALIPPQTLAALSNAIKVLVAIEQDKRAAEREREELTDREKLAFIKGLVDSSPQIAEEAKELLTDALSKTM